MQDTLVKIEMQEAGSGCVVVRCAGGLSWEDRNVLADRVERHLGGQAAIAAVVMDMNAVEFINSAGVGALFQLAQRLRKRGGRLAFANVPPRLVRLMRLSGLNRVALVCDDVESALGELAMRSEQDDLLPAT